MTKHNRQPVLTEVTTMMVTLGLLLSLFSCLAHSSDAENQTIIKAHSDGWFEIRSAGDTGTSVEGQVGNSAAKQVGRQTGRQGDKMYFVEPGDTLESISENFTGTIEYWNHLAEYNGISDPKSLATGILILIPEELLVRSTIRDTDSGISDSQIKEFFTQPDQSIGSLVSDIAVPPAPTQNIDMFIGEVKVLGVVAVNRVAVGRGAVVRAEVLASGELLVIANSMGSTSLRLWHLDGRQSDFNIRVSEHDPETRFHLEKMVRLSVRMVEFRKSSLGRLGIDWSDSAAGPTFATAGDLVSNSLFRPTTEGFSESLPNSVRPFSSYFGIASSLTSRINFLASTGDATVLAEPVLSCANGGSAEFLAGGEVPYPTVGANGQTSVEFKEYGIKLNISPKIDTAGNVQTKVLTEISSIDPAVSVQGAPGLLTRRTQTQVNVKTGQTIVIAGLLKSEQGRDQAGFPGLKSLPVLGALFRSRNVRNEASELVIFITPEVAGPEQDSMTERERIILQESKTTLLHSRGKLQIKILD